MKNKLIALLISVICGLTIQVNAQKNDKFTLTGQIKGLPHGAKLYLLGSREDTVCKTISTGEKFAFPKISLNKGRFYHIFIDTAISKIPFAVFFEDKPVFIMATLNEKNSLTVKGSPGHQDYEAFTAILVEDDKKAKEFRKASIKAFQNGNDSGNTNYSQKRRDLIRETQRVLDNDRNQLIKNWIANHKASLYAPYVISIALTKNVLKVQDAEGAYNRLTPDAKLSYYGLLLKGDLGSVGKTSKIQEGSIIPNFKIISAEGKELLIMDIAAQHKFTLIDFWASWCSPCRAAIPGLKKLYTDFKDKGLNIVGVSSDSNEAAWRKALNDDGAPWIQGIQGPGKLVNKLFDLKGIPSYILIDNKGKMLAFNPALSGIPSFGGSLRGEALEKKIEELLGKGKSN